MALYSLEGDTSGLPYTTRNAIPYEINALTPRETWGAGNSNTSIQCRQKWDRTVAWIKDMVGEVFVSRQTQSLLLKRHIPELIQYNITADGTDNRIQFCTIIDQIDQGGNPDVGAGQVFTNFAQETTNWPETAWARYHAVFESVPYAILDDATPLGLLPSVSDIVAGAGAFAGARELCRYVTRQRKSYTKEISVPGPNVAANRGFAVIDATRNYIPGGYAFRNRSFAEVSYTWIRVPIGWPPPVGWLPGAAEPVWPPKFNPAAGAPATLLRTRDSFLGTVNSTYFDCAAPDGYCWQPETLLYTGYDDSKKYYDAAGMWVCDIVYTFKFCEGGWNKYLSGSGEFVEVSADVIPGDDKHGRATGRKPYQTSVFDNLFRWS